MIAKAGRKISFISIYFALKRGVKKLSKKRNVKLMEIFSQSLKELRKERKMSQEDLALEIDSARTYISEIECSHKQPSLSSIFRIAGALKINAFELVKIVEEKYKNEE